jgi:hypothetical protein
MSSVLRTLTPFLDKALLLQSLDSINCAYSLQNNAICLSAGGLFILNNGRFQFQVSYSSYNHYRDIDFKEFKERYNSFLGPLEKAYNTIYQKKLEELERLRREALAEAERKRLEEERLRLERERQEYVEKQRTSIIAKAKEKGYSVREEKAKGKIKLVLVRNTY